MVTHLARVARYPGKVPPRHPYFSAEESQILAARLRARDADALTEVYDRMGTIVFSIILRFTRDATAAEDVTQEVFLRVWHRFPTFDISRGTLCRWILLMARCSAIDYWRSRVAVQSRINVSIETLDLALFAGSSRDGWQSYPGTIDIKAAVNRLNSKHRQLLQLAYFEGLSQSEIANRLQVPLGTVKTWVRLALRQIREDLDCPAVIDRPGSVEDDFPTVPRPCGLEGLSSDSAEKMPQVQHR